MAVPPPPLPPTQHYASDSFNLNSKVSPSILLVIIVVAIIFFVSGLLHLLVRYLLRPINRNPEDIDDVTALQGQLQQLFHLHDAGVDQSFIDTLPVFNYKSIIGLKDPFDCAVCLCEFEAEDKLRLLPKCSHAFHMECIDTWLLSHSTCPLCRAGLLPDFSSENSCSPIVLVLESARESSREFETSSIVRSNSFLGFPRNSDFDKSCEIVTSKENLVDAGEKILAVKLGNFKNSSIVGGESSSCNNGEVRRCFSMGVFEYVMDENTLLQVPIRTPTKKNSSKKPSLPLTPGRKLAMSECDCESRREFDGFNPITSNDSTSGSCKIVRAQKESFSFSKIWLRGGGKENHSERGDSSRRAFSLRFPMNNKVISGGDDDDDDDEMGRKNRSEFGLGLGFDEENQSCNSLDSEAKTPSFARRTLLWLVGRQK